MSLPPGFLDELRTRTSLAQVVGRKVSWDMRKSNQGKGDMWAPCPFHQEKTASFHVDDRQGFYYCFGCHAKGDAISFVRETENVDFMEAVRILAGETGVTMPERDPQAQQKADKRTRLAEVMEEAVKFFRLQLKTAAAGAARDYLSSTRGLSEAALDRWEIGFAPDAWEALRDHLTGKGIEMQMLLDCGLVKPSDRARQPYDTFRNRIMFPIRDARGRAIAFGGRAMNPDDNAKYLNSPETALFDKGRSLYNHGPAREASGKRGPLIVAEGYMDVIALSEAGFGATVAGLGTAITPDQLQLMWRMHPEPIIALDGDKAGIGAAMRLIDVALPLMEAGQSLRFCLLPEGMDPDDLLRAKGSGAMQELLDAAQPMISLLWRRETDGRETDSPERRAALDKDLRAVVNRIKDPSIKSHYGSELRRLREKLYGYAQRPQSGGGRTWKPRRGKAPPSVPVAGTRSSVLAAQGSDASDRLREAVVLATLVRTPSLLPEFVHVLEELAFEDPEHRQLAAVLLDCDPSATPEQVEADIGEKLGAHILETLLTQRHVTLAPSVRSPGDVDLARLCLTEELAKVAAQRGGQREIEEAMASIAEGSEEWISQRLSQAARARELAHRNHEGDKAEYDIAENGARIDRDEKSGFDALLRQIGFTEREKKPPQ